MTLPVEYRLVKEQATLWRCSPDAVYAAIAQGRLPALKIAGRWLLDPDDVRAFEQAARSVLAAPKRTRAPRRRATRR